MSRSLSLLVVVVTASAFGCSPVTNGGDAGLPSDDAFEPPAACVDAPSCTPALDDACGGDPTGSFSLCDACGEPALALVTMFAECPELQVTLFDVAPATGALNLDADGSYAFAYESALSFAFVIPGACTVGAQCEVGRPDPFLSASTCERYEDGSCDCTGALGHSVAHAGTWEVDAGSLLLTHDDVTDALPFCAADGALSVTLPAANDAPGAGLVLVEGG